MYNRVIDKINICQHLPVNRTRRCSEDMKVPQARWVQWVANKECCPKFQDTNLKVQYSFIESFEGKASLIYASISSIVFLLKRNLYRNFYSGM